MRSDKSVNYSYWFLMFFMYSVMGWVFEEIYSLYKLGFISDRGFMQGPYCIVYGIAGIMISSLLMNKKWVVNRKDITIVVDFLVILLIAATVELIGSIFLQMVGVEMWNYSDIRFNLNGRIALIPSLGFASFGLVGLFGISPAYQEMFRSIDLKILKVVSYILTAVMVADFIYTAIQLLGT